jgi:hypothetical protein
LESRSEEVEFAQYRSVEQISFTAKVSETSRGLGTDHGDPDKFNRCGELLVAGLETSLLELFPDPGEFGGEIAEGIGGVNVLDDQIQAIERVEADFGQAENLDVGFYSVAGRLPELGGDCLCFSPPDDALHLGENITVLVPFGQGEVEVAVFAT